MITSIIQHVFFKIQLKRGVQGKKRQRIYDLLNTETKPQKFKK